VHTHASIFDQLDALSTAWQWSPDDRIMNVLPLHHIHGIMNVLNSALWNGAECELVGGKFDTEQVWARLMSQ